MRPKVGWVGLGNMGLPMVRNLAKAGYDVVVSDKVASRANALMELGATVLPTARHIADCEGLDAIITMLPSTLHVQEVFEGTDGLFKSSGADKCPLYIDSSTIQPLYASELAKTVEKGVSQFVDAPVSGGVPGAVAASLTFMVGGSATAVSSATPHLKVMGKSVIHCGAAGAGQAAKVCNNLVLGISMAAVSEGLALGEALGLNPKLLTNIFNASSARCWSSDTYNPCPGVMENVPSSRGYQGGFGSQLMRKDLRLAIEAAAMKCQPVPMAIEAQKLYNEVTEGTQEPVDFSAIYRHVYKRALSSNKRHTF